MILFVVIKVLEAESPKKRPRNPTVDVSGSHVLSPPPLLLTHSLPSCHPSLPSLTHMEIIPPVHKDGWDVPKPQVLLYLWVLSIFHHTFQSFSLLLLLWGGV